jgi:lipid II isoglutaminyl synthase (glutamine-hydrolysing)
VSTRVHHAGTAESTVPRSGARPSRRVVVAAGLGRLAERLSRLSGLGAGGTIGGRVLLGLAPGAVRELSRGRNLTLISGTNGKTTTTAFVAAALRTLEPVLTNADGANTRAGIARTLASGPARQVVLETDEGWLPWLVHEAPEATPLLLNLSRDQLHRHHEVAHVARAWHAALVDAPHVVANADDAGTVMAGLAARERTWVALGGRWTQDSLVCPRCGGEIRHDGVDWECECGLRRPRPQWWLEGDELVSDNGRWQLELNLPGEVNRANAAVAVAATARLGVDPKAALDAIRKIRHVVGRYDVIVSSAHRTRLILAKNPASWAEALATVASSSASLVLAFNSEGVDGRDPSWLYDVPFAGLAGRPIVVTGRRATDMVVRLEMDELGDVPVAPDVAAAVAMLPPGDVDVIANYTAFQEARRVFRR